jgi:hypothetical protein
MAALFTLLCGGGGGGSGDVRGNTSIYNGNKCKENCIPQSLEFKSQTKIYNVERVVFLLLKLTHEAKTQT